MTQLALELDSVVKRFGDFTAVNNISLKVPTGSVCGFLGPNGAGKTTSIRMAMNIIKPDEGAIRVLGNPVSEEVKERIGYLPEERGVYKKMKVQDLIAYFGTLKGLSRGEASSRAERRLDEMGLGEWKSSRCQDLSKGMQQKVQFIATLLHDPELVILDEPFSGLDPVNTEVIKNKVLELRKSGVTVLFSTHIMDQAEKLCDSVILINHGQKVLDGSLAEVKSDAVAEPAVILEYDGDGAGIASLPQVRRHNDFGKYMEVFLKKEADPNDFLKQIVPLVSLRKFEVRSPTLHEIFLRAVGHDINVGSFEEAAV